MFAFLHPGEAAGNSSRKWKRLCLGAGEKPLNTCWGAALKARGRGEDPGRDLGPGARGRPARGKEEAAGAASAGSPGSSQRRLRNLPGSRRTLERNVTRPLPALPERGAEPRSGLRRPRDGRAGAQPRPAPTALPSPVSSFPPGSAEFIHWDWFQVTPSLYF